MIPKITQSKLDDIAERFASKLESDVKTLFSKPEYRSTNELLDSVAVKVTKASDTEAPLVILTYADQGYFIGYKNPQWTKLPNVDKLLEWIRSKKLDLGRIPGYSSGTAPNLTDEQRNSRIVWAIAKNQRKEDTWRPKRWKNSIKLSDLLKSLNDETLTAYTKDVETLLAGAIANGTVLA